MLLVALRRNITKETPAPQSQRAVSYIMSIRKATSHDAANIAAVSICVWVDTYATGGVFDKISRYALTELTEERIGELIRKKHVFVCEGERGLLGYMVVGPAQKDAVEIETLYVLPKFHRQGIGRRFVEKALIQFHTTALWLSVWERNERALKFYRRLGFHETGESFFDLYEEKVRNIVLTLHSDRGGRNA